jgi:copper homeostasis protein
MVWRNERISGMGEEEGSEFEVRTVDPERVREIRRLAENAMVARR